MAGHHNGTLAARDESPDGATHKPERTHPELLQAGRVVPSRGFADPLAAYLVPDRHATHGHGLWLGRQACDCVEVATDGTGTHVRLLTRLPALGGQEPVT